MATEPENRKDITTVEKLNQQLYSLPSIESMARMLELGCLLYKEAVLSARMIRTIDTLSYLDPYWEGYQNKDHWNSKSAGLNLSQLAYPVLGHWEVAHNYEYYRTHVRGEEKFFILCYRYGYYCLKTQSYIIALKWLTIAAEKGVAEASCAIGEIYENGLGVSKSLTTALVWYEQAAERGVADAQYHAALIYYEGLGVAKNFKKAFRFFKMGSEQGLTLCMYYYAHCLCEGEGTSVDYDAAAVWYEKAANEGNPDAQYELAFLFDPDEKEHLWRGKDEAKCVQWFLAAAEQDIPWAQYLIAERYAKGKGVSLDEKKASYWYQRAADLEESLSQYEIGRRFENGIGVEVDSEKAFHYYKLSAQQGERIAKFALGICYEEGKGTDIDAKKAVKQYCDLLEGKDDITKDALLRLAKLYEEGKLVEKDSQKAFGYYRTLADDYGDIEATYYVAKGLETGEGCYKSEVQAADYYYTLATKSYRDSQRRYLMLSLVNEKLLKEGAYGWIKELTHNKDWDIKVAFALYVCKKGKSRFSGKQCRNAKSLLEMVACSSRKKLYPSIRLLLNKIYLQLAECYRYGIGCRINMRKAIKWYKKLEKKEYGKEAETARKELCTYAFAKECAAMRKKKGFLAMLSLTAIFLSVFLSTMFIHMARSKDSFGSSLAYFNEQTVIWSSAVWYISLVFASLCFIGTIISLSIYVKRRR